MKESTKAQLHRKENIYIYIYRMGNKQFKVIHELIKLSTCLMCT